MEGKRYWLQNMEITSVTDGGTVRLYFDLTKDMKRLIRLANKGIYYRWGWADPLSGNSIG